MLKKVLPVLLLICCIHMQAQSNKPAKNISHYTVPGKQNSLHKKRGKQALRPLAPPANDDPCNAITLPVNDNCVYSNYTNLGATGSAVADPGCADYQGGDVWFQVTVPASGFLKFDTREGTMSDGGMAIYTGIDCDHLNLVACDDDASSNGLMPFLQQNGLAPGTTVWIRIWSYSGTDDGTFDICVSSPPPPPPVTNDDPCDAIPVNAESTCNYHNFSNEGATGTVGAPAPGCASYNGGDVWFSVIVPPEGSILIDTKDETLTDAGMAIYSGASCNNLTLIDCNDDGSSNFGMSQITANGLTPGSTIWIRIWEYGGGTGGIFGLCVKTIPPPPVCGSSPPAGNTCESATPVCNFSGYCGNTSADYTDDYWPELFDAFDACLGGGTSIDNNSFLSFVASDSTAIFNVWVTNSQSGMGIQLMFYEGGCGSGPVTCHGGYNDVTGGPTTVTATDLIPGNTYYLMIDGVAGDVCDYSFDPVSGVNIMTVTPSAASICNGNGVTLTASGGNGVYTWSPATGLNTTTGATVIANPAVTTTYTVTTTGAGDCPVTMTRQVTVSVINPPAAPTANPVSYCEGAAASPLTASGTNLLWYTTSSGGTGSATAPTPSTAAAGITTYYVSQSTGTCESPRTAVTVTVSAQPAAPVVTSPVSYCQGATASSLSATGTNLLWYTTASGGTGSATAPVPSTATSGSTTYYVSQTTGGCESPRSAITVVVTSPTTSTTTISICPSQLPYSWNGNNYNAAGTYNLTLTNSTGCDSVATLNLTVKSTSTSTTPISVCPSQLPYSWSGNSYNAAGTYTVHFTAANGCDSAATLNLTVKTTSSSTTAASICPSQLPYSWNGNSYNAAGSYTVHFTGANGCDSAATLNLTVKATSSSATAVSICPSQLPYSWNSQSYNSTGSYSVTLVNSVGCDSIATLNLTVKANTSSTTNIAVCPAQLPYTWNGNTYNAAGIYTATLTNNAGCDSIATLNLSIKNNTSSITNTTICTGQVPYIWNGNSYNTSGSYTVTLINNAGCDSVAVLNLTIKNNAASTTNVTVCAAQLPFTWNGNVYNSTGVYTAVFTATNGCDSVATLDFTVDNYSRTTTPVTICSSLLPYTWNGQQYNTTGNYADTLTGSSGCDSISILALTVIPVTYSSTTVSVCPSQLPYMWNGNSYSSSGSYAVTLTNAGGCDSVATLVFTVLSNSSSTTNITVCEGQMPYTWNGQQCNSAGNYSVTLINSAGCDSVATLNLHVNYNSIGSQTISVCPSQLPYLWNGLSINTTGTYTTTIFNNAGCDSVVTLNLTVLPVPVVTQSIDICPSQFPYNWNGISINTAGTYRDTTTGSNGCDSISIITVNQKPVSSSNTPLSICPSQLPYTWNGNTYNSAGTYSVTLTGSNGCDSVATLMLTVKTNSSSTTNIGICPAQLPYLWNGNSYTAAGTYNVTLTNNAGCDSTATLILFIKSVSISNTSISICPNQLPFRWNNNVYAAGGNYSVTLTNAQGCDSIANLQLIVKTTSASNTPVSICPSQLPYLWNGNNYNAGGIYRVTLVNSQGCDSIATLTLTVRANTTGTTIASICEADLPYRWNGNNYSSSGAYTAALTNSTGCDSTDILILKVNKATIGNEQRAVCSNELPFTWNGSNYTEPGTYTALLTNADGCDSTVTLTLSINNPPTVSIGTDTVLCPNETITLRPGNFNAYQWQDLSSTSFYTVTRQGIYSVRVTDQNGCSNSASVNVNYYSDCSDLFFPNAITPNNDGINDKFGPLGKLFIVSQYRLTIFNRYGEVVFSSTNPYQKWDGLYKGKLAANSNFVWEAEYVILGKRKRMHRGNLLVIQ